MAKDGGKSSLRTCLRGLWLGRAMPLTRAVAGLASAALIGALALATAWMWTATVWGIEHSTVFVSPSRQLIRVSPGTVAAGSLPAGTRSYTYYRVDPRIETTSLAVALAAAAWLALLWRIWGPPRGNVPSAASTRRRWQLWVTPPLLSFAIILAAFAATMILNTSAFVPGDIRYLETMILMAAGGLLLISWLGVIEQMQQRRFRPVLDAHGQVDVRCPACGYSLIGLRELRCPECGMQFTIDELIRAQRYEAPKVS